MEKETKLAYKITEQKELPNSEVEIHGEVAAETLAPFRQKALKNLGENAKIAGFRSGHIPEKVLVEKFGEQAILEDAADLALQEIVPEVVQEKAPRYIARPKITITKLAPGNPLNFSVVIAVRPEFSLPNYKKIGKEEVAASQTASEHEKLAVTDKEIDEVIEKVRDDYAHHQFHQHQQAEGKAEGHNHSPEEVAKHKPEINDEFVKSLGAFKDVADFRAKIKENLTREKENKLAERRRGKILERLVTETKFPIPQPLINYELNRMFGQFEEDIKRMGLSLENYLKHLKKSQEDLKKEWLPEAEKRARVNLILEEIALKEKLTADPKDVETETRRLKAAHADLDTAQIENYLTHMLTIEKTIKFLEDSK